MRVFWDREHDKVVTEDELRYYFETEQLDGEFDDYIKDCVGKNGTLMTKTMIEHKLFDIAMVDRWSRHDEDMNRYYNYALLKMAEKEREYV